MAARNAAGAARYHSGESAVIGNMVTIAPKRHVTRVRFAKMDLGITGA